MQGRLNLNRTGPSYLVLEGVPPALGERDLAELAANTGGLEQIAIYNNVPFQGQQHGPNHFAVFTFDTKEGSKPAEPERAIGIQHLQIIQSWSDWLLKFLEIFEHYRI